MFIRILKVAREQKQISQSMYEHFMMKTFEPETWEQAFDELLIFAEEIYNAIQNHEYYILLDRLAKGEEMIEKETDPKKKAEYIQLYNKLKQQLEQIEGRMRSA